MDSQRYAEFRAKWLANHREARAIVEAVERATPRRPKLVVVERPSRVYLTREEYEVIHEAVLKGMTAFAAEEVVTSRQFRLLREAWSKLAPVQGNPRFIVEVGL